MIPPSALIRKLLIDLHLGTASGEWPIYVAFLPETPNEAIVVHDTAGKLDGRIMEDGEQVEHPGVQIRVSGQNYPDASNKAQSIALAIDAQRKVLVVVSPEESYTVFNISRTGAVI